MLVIPLRMARKTTLLDTALPLTLLPLTVLLSALAYDISLFCCSLITAVGSFHLFIASQLKPFIPLISLAVDSSRLD